MAATVVRRRTGRKRFPLPSRSRRRELTPVDPLIIFGWQKSRTPRSCRDGARSWVGGSMTMRHMGAALAAVLVSTALPAWGQGAPGWEQKLPDGAGKQVVGNT